MSYNTIHPLSSLPKKIPYDILVDKYCRLLEGYYSFKSENKQLQQLIIDKDNKDKLINQLSSQNILTTHMTHLHDTNNSYESYNLYIMFLIKNIVQLFVMILTIVRII
jgi:hypothetical protein